MKTQESTIVFDQEFASSYDKQFAKLAPMRDGLHSIWLDPVTHNYPLNRINRGLTSWT